MPADSPDAAAVPCHRCDYDVRAQPADGVCPECGASVAESRRTAHIVRRPVWGNSDPRWRRRMIAGTWVLVAVPLVAWLQAIGWDDRVPMPAFFQVQGSPTLSKSHAVSVYPWLTFCIGVALLFSRERFRRRGPLDWTRRWGVTASYGVLLLGWIGVGFIMALVLVGISALCLAMPLRYQPAVTDALVQVSVGYLRHGPHPSVVAATALHACSAIVVLLACAPLYDALRSCGHRAWAAIMVAPLVLGAVRQLAYLALHAVGMLPPSASESPVYPFFFNSSELARGIASLDASNLLRRAFLLEAAKWLACLAIAVQLTIAQLAAMRWRRATT